MNKAAQLFHQIIDETLESLKTEIDLSFAVADRIAALLKRNGMTQKELARLTQTSEAAVCKWLSGTHNFTFSTIGKISAAIEVERLCYSTLKVLKDCKFCGCCSFFCP